MKRFLLITFCFAIITTTPAQTIASFGFDGTTSSMLSAGWTRTNQSTPIGIGTWGISSTGSNSFPNGGHSGGISSFALVNFQSTTTLGTISNWLISPVYTLNNGDVVSFYTRKGGDATVTPIAPDNLQVRLSTLGAASVVPSGGANELGSFTDLKVEINPNLENLGTSYPFVWTRYQFIVQGLTQPTNCRVAFRYYVTNAGPISATVSFTNSDIIAIDDFLIEGPLAAEQFDKSSISIYPNPAINEVKIKSDDEIASFEIIDNNGRIVLSNENINKNESTATVSSLNSGLYFLKIRTKSGIQIKKISKN